jgi:hypothetical protein
MARKISFNEAIQERAEEEKAHPQQRRGARRRTAPANLPPQPELPHEVRFLDVGATVPPTPAGPPTEER